MAVLRDAPEVSLFTDGACSGNPGPGGYGVILAAGHRHQELSRGFRRTTNNRMEILAVIVGLEALSKPSRVNLFSDSQYVVHAITKGWLTNWRKNGWRTASKQAVANVDLWQRLLPLLAKHDVRADWIRGHTGHPENERADRLAVAALQSPDLATDEGYEHA